MSSFKEKLMKNLFCEVSSVVWDLQTRGLGIRTPDGVFTIAKNEEGKYEGTMNPLDMMSFDIPALATRRTVESVNPGDIIIRGKKNTPIFVTGKEGDKVRVLHPEGMQGSAKAIKNTVLGGQAGIMVVQNFLAEGGENTNSMLPMLLMMEEKTDKKDMGMLMLAMSMSQGGQNNQMTQMLPFLLMGGEGKGMSDKLMMMMAMSGGTNSMLPFMMMNNKEGGE